MGTRYSGTISESLIKQAARQTNIEYFEKFTGCKNIPADREYWTLCNDQTMPGSEIEQLTEMGFLAKSQFNGVDRQSTITGANKMAHPPAHWYTGEWTDVIGETEAFAPALIYLDSVCFADGLEAMRLLASTMPLSPQGTVLLFNVLASTPYSSRRKIDCDFLTSQLHKHIPSRELSRWNKQIPSFLYTASRTQMCTYAFYKET